MNWFKKENEAEAYQQERIQKRIDSLMEKSVEIADKEIENYKEGKRVDIDKQSLKLQENVIEILKQTQKDLANYEHEYHSAKEDKNVTLAKLQSDIEFKRQLLASMVDSSEIKLKATIESKDAIIAAKDDVIKLLKDQVEILTAKLTEIKITDAHINIDCDSLLAKAMESKK